MLMLCGPLRASSLARGRGLGAAQLGKLCLGYLYGVAALHATEVFGIAVQLLGEEQVTMASRTSLEKVDGAHFHFPPPLRRPYVPEFPMADMPIPS